MQFAKTAKDISTGLLSEFEGISAKFKISVKLWETSTPCPQLKLFLPEAKSLQ